VAAAPALVEAWYESFRATVQLLDAGSTEPRDAADSRKNRSEWIGRVREPLIACVLPWKKAAACDCMGVPYFGALPRRECSGTHQRQRCIDDLYRRHSLLIDPLLGWPTVLPLLLREFHPPRHRNTKVGSALTHQKNLTSCCEISGLLWSSSCEQFADEKESKVDPQKRRIRC
jgi:hypothetical protein